MPEVEVPDDNEDSECRHEERRSEVQDMSDDEGEVQRGDEQEKGSRQASEAPWSADDIRDRQACRVTLAIP